MDFKGNGLIYDPKKKKVVVNFNRTPIFSTDDKYFIELLKNSSVATQIDEPSHKEIESVGPDNKYLELTKKDLVKIAKESGVKGSDRMSREKIIEALNELKAKSN